MGNVYDIMARTRNISMVGLHSMSYMSSFGFIFHYWLIQGYFGMSLMVFSFLKVKVVRFGVISTELSLGSWRVFFIRAYSGLF